uniref:Uncharacterized protein n=1 Tax=Caenorhabditis japonica TaxID=281687 RepID=A0A8R1J1B6_CAEJA
MVRLPCGLISDRPPARFLKPYLIGEQVRALSYSNVEALKTVIQTNSSRPYNKFLGNAGFTERLIWPFCSI